jgi:succinate dehydrogenase/fumarate reductase flavoprotein subunit
MTTDLTADLVVVGYGAAGAAAALAAERLGADVLVCEKQASNRHTPSTRMSGGIVMTANDADGATRYLDGCAGGMIPPAVSAAWARAAVELPDWLAEHAVHLELNRCGGAEHPALDGASAIDTLQPGASGARLDPSGGAGTALWSALSAAVATRPGVRVRWESPARRLLTEAGRVVGVEVGRDGDAVRIRARDGVVLACGGYEFDEELKRDHLRTHPVHFYGNPGNSGDGVRMAQAVGAGLWHMNQMIGRAIGKFRLDDGTEQGFIIGIDPPGYVITDRYGRRFANEEPQARLLHGFYYELLAFDNERGEYPRNPCYWFFDERRRQASPLTYTHIGACAVGLYDWSPDNSVEIDRGWIARGDTPEAAAAAAGVVDPEAAGAAVRAYNDACKAGEDPFGRPAATLVPLDTPPYYCVPLWAGGSNTSGGPRRDEHARVLDAFGAPIPGLFAAGELGQAMGLMYPADGSNISEALCFGRIAAETAAGVRGTEAPEIS